MTKISLKGGATLILEKWGTTSYNGLWRGTTSYNRL